MFSLKINNFRSLKESQFEFKRLNILIGENSSGKSSLIKFLQLLCRSYRGYNLNFNFTSELGSYSDFVYLQNEDSIISFEFDFDNEYYDYFKYQNEDDEDFEGIINQINDLNERLGVISLKYSFGKEVNSKNHIQTEIRSENFGQLMIYRQPDDKEDLLKKEQCTIQYNDENNVQYVMNNISFDRQGFLTIVHGVSLAEVIELNYPNSKVIFYKIAVLLITQNYLRNILLRMRYINPIDSSPSRTYGEMESQGIYPVKDLKDVVNILTDESIHLKERSYLKERLNEALRKYGLIYELKIVSKGYETKIVKVKLAEDSIWNNIKDVGYGTALQIPMLFQAILGETAGGELIMIEQPEIHIHPQLQAKFIEVLLNIGPRNKYIIETHSEDIIRKIQVMVKKSEANLNSDDVRIYYFKKAKKNISKPELHTLNQYGKLIPPFPTGFYDSSSNLVKELF